MANARRSPDPFKGITQIDIINRSETVRFKSTRGREIQLKGSFADRQFGQSAGDGTLYLVRFDGELTVPEGVRLNYKRGVADIQKELIDTYAPSLDYGEIVRVKRGAEELARYRDVPVAEVLDLTRRFTGATMQPFFSSQTQLSSPPSLKILERRQRAKAFSRDGQYNVMPKLESGQNMLIPEIEHAAPDQLFDKTLEFVARRLAAGQSAVQGIVLKMNQLSKQEGRQLLDFALRIQEVMPKTEAEVHALATKGAQKAEQRFIAAAEMMAEKKLPFGIVLKEKFAGAWSPISHEPWAALMGELAAREYTASSKGSRQSAPASEATTHAHVDLRDEAQLEAALQSKQQFCMVLRTFARSQLRKYQMLDLRYQQVTAERLRDWRKRSQGWEENEITNLEERAENRRQHVRFDYDKKKNAYRIREMGEYNDRQYESGNASPPTSGPVSPSPGSPAAPPTGDTEEGWGSWIRSWLP
jgi:hypothetical protein